MKNIYKKIAGICAGIGEIYDYDPNIVRIVAVFLCVLTQLFPLVVAYLAGWYLIPEKSPVESKKEENVT